MAALFYHLSHGAPEAVVGRLAERALDAGHLVELRGTDPEALAALDAALWLREGFIAHGRATGGAVDARQPVLLTLPGEDAGPRDCLIATGAAPVSDEEARRLARVSIVFDGGSEAALVAARAQWRQMAAAGIAAEYWTEEAGRWQRKR